METKEIVNTLLAEEKMTARAFATHIGITPSQIYDLQSGKIKKISSGVANKIIASFPKYNWGWLTSGIGEMCGVDAEQRLKEMASMVGDNGQILPSPQIGYDKTIGVPYYDVDFLGGFDLLGSDQTVTPQYMVDFQPYNKATCLCNISGDSMSPLINNGDMIALQLIEDSSWLVMGDIYAIVATNGLRTVKRIEEGNTPDTYMLIPVNEDYKPQSIPKNKIQTVFRVMGCMKKL